MRICWDVFRTVCCPLSWPAEISANQKGPSEPMTKEEAAKRDEEIAALEKKGVDVMKKEWFERTDAVGWNKKRKKCVCLCGR